MYLVSHIWILVVIIFFMMVMVVISTPPDVRNYMYMIYIQHMYTNVFWLDALRVFTLIQLRPTRRQLADHLVDHSLNKYIISQKRWQWSYGLLKPLVFMQGISGEISWSCHQMETFFVLLALCADNWPVTGEFPTQRPVTRNFDGFFYLRLNKRLGKQSQGWWFETPSCPLWRHSNVHTHTFLPCLFCCDLIISY